MDKKGNSRPFPKERRRIVLRADDIGTIKGHFEVHFDVLVPNETITPEICDAFDEKISCLGPHTRIKQSELDILFEETFKVQLEGKHVTLEAWKTWCKTFENLIESVLKKRERRRRGSDNDRR